jgi:hypothetical protein
MVKEVWNSFFFLKLRLMNEWNIIYRILKWLTDEEIIRTSSEYPSIQYLIVEMSRKTFNEIFSFDFS